MPTVDSITDNICVSRFAHCRPMNLRSLSRSSRMSLNFSMTASTRCRNLIPVSLPHLGLLPLSSQARAVHLNERLPKCDGDWYRAAGVGDPYTIDQIEMLNVLRQCLGDDERDVGSASALVIAELGKPSVAPSLCSLRLPKNDPSCLADRAIAERHRRPACPYRPAR
jgi:hypothetical protein